MPEDFTLSNARRFYSSKGDPSGLKGLKLHLIVLQLVLFLVHSRSSFLVFQFTVSEFLFYLSLAGWKFILIAYKVFTVYFKDFLMKTMPCSPFWFFHFVFALMLSELSALMLSELSCEKEIQRLVWLPVLPKSLNCNLRSRSATHPGVTKEAVYLTIQDGMTYRIPRECDTVYFGKTHQKQPRKGKPCYFTCLYSDLCISMLALKFDLCLLWNKVNFIDQDPHCYTIWVKKSVLLSPSPNRVVFTWE